MSRLSQRVPEPSPRRPAIVGDVVFGGAESPVAVCTLASRSLLAELAGRSEIAVAGRVFTENVGIERMVANLAAFDRVRFLIVCGRETRHRVGETILALHKHGLDRTGRVIGSPAPEPLLPNLTPDELSRFQRRVAVLDLIGETDPAVILARARDLATRPAGEPASATPGDDRPGRAASVALVPATPDPVSDWEYDPVGYHVIFVDRNRGLLRVEHHDQDHRLVTVYEGRGAPELGQTIVRRGGVTLLAHAVYLGRELAKAEAALTFGLEYEQDRRLSERTPPSAAPTLDDEEETGGDSPGNRRAP